MPIYEYKCRKCGEEFEELVLSGDDIPICPSCESGECDRLLSAFSRGDSEGEPNPAQVGCGSGGFT